MVLVNNASIKQKEFRVAERLMGNAFEITVVSDNQSWALDKIAKAIDEIKRIEALLTTYNDESQVNRINQQAGKVPVRVDREVFDLIDRSIKLSELTNGAFDITYGSIDKRLWNFDQSMTALPDSNTAKAMVRLINYRNIILNEVENSVFLKESGMRIGFGGIGKGYAAEMAKSLLQKDGVENGIVNAAGDITTWGMQSNHQPWTVGIVNPNHAATPFAYLKISNLAIATSGNYEKFITVNGKKYSHTINPKTGLPITGIKSVTVIARHAELADAMTTPVAIMGITAGLDMVNQIAGMGCILIDDNNKIFTSKNINLK